MQDDTNMAFKAFIVENRIKVNRYLNKILWSFVITGPAIALGVKAGIFPDISYFMCFSISLIVILLSLVHLILLKNHSDASFTSVFALIALDILLVHMTLGHVSINLTWFLVPLLSILFCDDRLYLFALIVNFVMMSAANWFVAPYYSALNHSFENPLAYFLDVMGGYAIETLITGISGYMIVRISMDYYKRLFAQTELIKEKEKSEQEKLDILDSMAEIYDNVNLISFVDNTEMSLRDEKQQKHGIDMNTQTHTLMNQRIKKQVMGDQLDDFLTFTNITTVRDRMENKKIISADFIDVIKGWFRAQYITVEKGADDKPDMVIYTTRNVDEEKRREEHLYNLSMTDELTRLHNRRSYEEDLGQLRKHILTDDFVLFSIDVNGLKTINDTLGHKAGDELIKGASDCLALSIRQNGKIYRTGGDEFVAIVHTDKPEEIRKHIMEMASKWHGTYCDELSMSIGYAGIADHKDSNVDELEHIADSDMYNEKEKYYSSIGHDRRRH